MSCYHPIDCVYNNVDRKIVAFGQTLKSYLSNPRFDGRVSCLEDLKLPCGHCIGCSLRESKNWVIRILLEQFYQYEFVNNRKPLPWCFLTLTYDDYNLPRLDDGRPTLNYSDLRKFFQTVKDVYDYYDLTDPITKSLGKKPWRFYYAPGEYGDKFGRPHYHAIVVGLDFFELDRKILNKEMNAKLVRKFGEYPVCKEQFVSKKQIHYNTPLLSECWTKGFATVSVPSTGAICYTAGYVDKKRLVGLRVKDYYAGREPEKAIMTQSIGRAYFEKFYKEMSQLDYIYFVDKKFPMPRYFDKRLEKVDLDMYAKVKERRRLYMETDEFKLAHTQQHLEAAEAILMQKYERRIKPYENMTGNDIFGSSFFNRLKIA